MTLQDDLGLPLSGATPDALDDYRTALRRFQCFAGDPVAPIEAALAAAPGFVMAHALRAYLYLLGTEPQGLAVARASLDVAYGLPMTGRERGHLAAIEHLIAGCWRDAARALEDVALDAPRDILALQAGHAADFFRGDSRMLRDRIARALPAWDSAMPGYHALLGMRAFGLEEMGHYAEAEIAGRRAVEMEPRDGWAQHAVAHVMEMQGRTGDGIAWMRAAPEVWSAESALAVHNWWHLALYHLDLGEIDEVLALYDAKIFAPRSKLALEMIDASAMLWRLMLRGVDVGGRWQPLADDWAPHAGTGFYAFNDFHAAMAFVGAGRPGLIEDIFAAQEAALGRAGDNAAFTREVGLDACRAIVAFGAGDYRETVRLLRPLRHLAARFGGSHAQRDLIDLTLLEAALRGGEANVAQGLAAERLALRPASPAAQALALRASGRALKAA